MRNDAEMPRNAPRLPKKRKSLAVKCCGTRVASNLRDRAQTDSIRRGYSRAAFGLHPYTHVERHSTRDLTDRTPLRGTQAIQTSAASQMLCKAKSALPSFCRRGLPGARKGARKPRIEHFREQKQCSRSRAEARCAPPCARYGSDYPEKGPALHCSTDTHRQLLQQRTQTRVL